nr:hypothetical protein [Streptomyces sp. V1I1]
MVRLSGPARRQRGPLGPPAHPGPGLPRRHLKSRAAAAAQFASRSSTDSPGPNVIHITSCCDP